jgi:hypothetical protein
MTSSRKHEEEVVYAHSVKKRRRKREGRRVRQLVYSIRLIGEHFDRINSKRKKEISIIGLALTKRGRLLSSSILHYISTSLCLLSPSCCLHYPYSSFNAHGNIPCIFFPFSSRTTGVRGRLALSSISPSPIRVRVTWLRPHISNVGRKKKIGRAKERGMVFLVKDLERR